MMFYLLDNCDVARAYIEIDHFWVGTNEVSYEYNKHGLAMEISQLKEIYRQEDVRFPILKKIKMGLREI